MKHTHMQRRPCSLVRISALLAALRAVLAPAHATVLSEDALAEESTEIGMVARAFSFVLTGGALEPPIMPVDANPTGMGIFDLRGYFAHETPSLKLVVHAQLSSAFRSHGRAGALAVGRGVAPPRWLPLTARLADEDTISITGSVDWLHASWTREGLTLTVGRQPVTFGRAKLWSPTDLIATFALTEVDTEYKPGVDGVRLDVSATERIGLTLVASTGELEEDSDIEASLHGTSVLARGKWGWDRGEVGMTSALIRGDAVAGLDTVIDTGSFEIYGEATATLVTGESVSAPRVEPGDVVAKAVVGATFRPGSEVTLSPELVYNGFGAAQADDYLETALSPRVGIGEQIMLGTHYAGLLASWQVHPLVQVGGVALANVRDPSALVSLALRASLADNTEAVLGGYVGLGALPEVDLAQGTVLVRDEFGLYPRFLFAELKAVY